MGSKLSNLVDKLASKLFNKVDAGRIVMIGLDGVGKTTILYKLKLGQFINTVPSIGFNVEEVKYKGLTMTIWDIGGHEKIRGLWKHYNSTTRAIIFVVDSCDDKRLDLAKSELDMLLKDEGLKDAFLLVFANKRDIGKLTITDIINSLELQNIQRPWKIQDTCAVTGEGLYEGLDWLHENLSGR